ncbi:hypothetical protein NFHSH190041_33100 [Shewanella sp. NFH-SH190041]|nr:hypothetical protein NFHSH190041_33100 [Shewanella sp. NFH-SH190041]
MARWDSDSEGAGKVLAGAATGEAEAVLSGADMGGAAVTTALLRLHNSPNTRRFFMGKDKNANYIQG